MDDYDKDIKVDAKLDSYKGILKIDILDVLNQLDENTKKEFLSDAGWRSLVTQEMAKEIVEKFSRESWDSLYTELRSLILNSESMPKVIVEWAESVMESRERAKEQEKYWRRAYHELRSWIYDKLEIKYSREELYQKRMLIPDLPKSYYGKSYTEEMIAEAKKKAEEWADLFPDKDI